VSRKWERMVDRNTQMINKKREKLGKERITTASDNVDRFFGRNWIFPLILIIFAVIFLVYFREESQSWTFWFTVIAYTGLGLFFFFFRRPFLFIGKTQLASRRFRGIKGLDHSQIYQIVVQPDYIFIDIKGKRVRWMFSRWFHFFNIEQLSKRLHEFAEHNKIPIKIEVK